MLTRLLLVGLGGFCGSILRYWVGEKMAKGVLSADFPWNTFVVNVSGCLLIGVLLGWTAARGDGERIRLFAVMGLLGGFTTFSTFGFESFRLVEIGRMGAFVVNVVGQLGLGLAAVMIGLWLGRSVSG